MAEIMSDKLPQTLTWWAASGGDGFGGDLFAAPLAIKGRWEDRTEKYIGQLDRRELISNAVVFVDRDVAVGDYLVQGDQTAQANPTLVAGAYKVQQFKRVSDIRNVETVKRAVL